MSHIRKGILFVVVVTFAASSQPTVYGNDLHTFVMTRYDYAKNVDSLLIATHDTIFHRNNSKKLEIKLIDKESKSYESEPGLWNPYTIVKYYPDLEYVLIRWHEHVHDGGYILLDRYTGQKTAGLNGIPLFSPDKKRFAIISAGNIWFSNEISVYKLPPCDTVQFPEYNTEPEWAPLKAEWISNGRIRIIGKADAYSKEEMVFTLEHGENGWKIVRKNE